MCALDQLLIASVYARIGSELGALNNTSWIATAYVVYIFSFFPFHALKKFTVFYHEIEGGVKLRYPCHTNAANSNTNLGIHRSICSIATSSPLPPFSRSTENSLTYSAGKNAFSSLTWSSVLAVWAAVSRATSTRSALRAQWQALAVEG